MVLVVLILLSSLSHFYKGYECHLISYDISCMPSLDKAAVTLLTLKASN